MSAPVPVLHPAETPASTSDPRVLALARLVGIVDRLRAPDGCPWDRKQTLASMGPHLIEEAHEVLEAIETSSDADTLEECGDVLMVVMLLARIAEDEQRFDLAAAAHAVSAKLVRRHPHVFGEVDVKDADQVLANWEAIKKSEREAKETDSSALAGVPLALPALQRAARLSSKAVSAGFRWSDVAGAVAKLREEQSELDEVLRAAGLDRDAQASCSAEQRAAAEHELGDVLLAAAFLANYLKMDPERLCREAARRFERRFRAMERDLAGPMGEQSLSTLMAAWERAKLAQG